MENKIKQKLYSKYKKYLARYFRLSSYPYVSGDTFRDFSKFIYDEYTSFNPENLKNKDIVFVKTDLLEDYFKYVHPKIKVKYILLSHNSDEIINSQHKKYLDSKIIHWFAQNLVEEFADNVSVIPIGLENRWYLNNGRLRNLKRFENDKYEKDFLVLSAFNPETNKERFALLQSLKNNDLIDKPEIDNKTQYLDFVSKSKFVLCPEGNGPDTHRVWESLLFESIPVMKESKFTKILEKSDVPILTLNNWSEIKDLDSEILNNFYEQNKVRFKSNKYSYFSFWENKINQYLDE
ncbi:hypothetical protein OAN51_01200 [Acidimicrobiia bacterium]|nr:hypothetical protein [Acidimicrobiia bacterium]